MTRSFFPSVSRASDPRRAHQMRAGFATLTALWIIAAATISTLAFARAGRTAIDATHNRVALRRARWIALGCAHRARAAIDSALRAADTDRDATLTWRTLAAHVDTIAAARRDACHIELRAAGTRLDVNAATDEMFQRLGVATNVGDVDAVVRRIDSARAIAPIDDDRQLHGLLAATSAEFVASLGIEAGRTSLATAAAPTLVAIPGVSREAADAIVARRATVGPLDDLTDVLSRVSQTAADSLVARYPDASRLTTPDPDAWLLTASAGVDQPAMIAALQWRLVRSGRRAHATAFRTLS